MTPILEWGIPIIEWFQNLGESLFPIMNFFTFLGTENFYLIVMPSLLWCFDAALGFRLGLLLLTSSNLNAVLKLALGLPRPYWVSDNVRALGSDPYFGAPSGHAQNAVALWGRLATVLRNRWITLGAGILILGISISRLYLGVHFPTDVILGWLLGGSLLFLFIRLERPVMEWMRRRSIAGRLVAATLVSLSLLLLGVLASVALNGREVPADWAVQAARANPEAEPISPTNIDAFISTSGVFLGISTGGVLLFEWDGFDPRGPYSKRLLRFLVGVIGVVIIYFGLRKIFPTEPHLLGHTLRFIRYAGVGFWVSYLAPRLFVRLNLA